MENAETTQNKAVVRRFVDEFQGQARVEVLDELLSRDFVNHSGTVKDIPCMEGAQPCVGVDVKGGKGEVCLKVPSDGDLVVRARTPPGRHLLRPPPGHGPQARRPSPWSTRQVESRAGGGSAGGPDPGCGEPVRAA